MPYEYHIYEDPEFRVIFHPDGRDILIPDARFHWHIHPEFLYFTEGEAVVCLDETEISVKKGELLSISSNCLHTINSVTPFCQYYCLIPDIEYCGGLGVYPIKCTNSTAIEIFKSIVEEYETTDEYYKIAIKGYIAALAACIARNQDKAALPQKSSDKLTVVKAAVEYMYKHFSENFSIDDICREVGLSKYYLCHIFKQAMGVSILNHLNYIRCRKARTLLRSGMYNVSQSAYECGFRNLSYFSKTYKEIIGNLPTNDLKK